MCKPIRSQLFLTLGFLILQTATMFAQRSIFKRVAFDSAGIIPYELYPTKEGLIQMTSSVGIWKLKGNTFDGPSIGTGIMYDDKGKPIHQNIKTRNYTAEDSIRGMAQGPDSCFWFVAHDNFFLFRPNGKEGGWGWPPFILPKTSSVSKIWIDDDTSLFAGTTNDNFYFIKNISKYRMWDGVEIGASIDSTYEVRKSKINAEQIIIGQGLGVFSFASDANDKKIIWIGTNRGLYTWNKISGKIDTIGLDKNNNTTITEIYTGENRHVWFSTLEKGMGVYDLDYKTIQFYSYSKNKTTTSTKFPIKTFCYKSPGQFFVAIMDSLPAVFSTQSREYLFFQDSVLLETPNRTIDIKVDKYGNLAIIKGESFFITDVSQNEFLKTSVIRDSSSLAPFFRQIKSLNGQDISNLDFEPQRLKKLVLTYDKNSFFVFYDVNDFGEEKDIRFAWRVDGYTAGWVESFSNNSDGTNFIPFQDLKPGKYLLQLKAKVGNEEWRKEIAELEIIIEAPYWQTWWFWASVITGLGLLIFFIVKIRVNAVREQERVKAKYEKELIELEAKALRAQMNPHFIFNCLNSIKSLIQDDKKDKSVTYLTTFSKLIRTLFNNADKKEISLHDELETCKLYLQLEAMRFDSKFSYAVNIDNSIDLKSVQVPALIIQPFIENAIWHGIVPCESGGHISLEVVKKNSFIEIIIDDNGIGREASWQNKSTSGLTHKSKGVNLTQSRLELDNLLQQREATLEIIDKKGVNGVATGTTVILRVKETE